MDLLQTTTMFQNTLLDWLYFLLALLLTFAASKLVSKVVIKGLEKAAKKTITQLDDLFVKVINHPLRLSIQALGLHASFALITLPSSVENFIQDAINSLLIFALYWVLHNGVDVISYSLSRLSKKMSNEVINFLAKGVKFFILFLGAMTILQQWGLNVSGFIASLGLGGLAFALAAKDTAANLFGSLVIFIDKPFNVGDWIKTPEVEGTIVDIGIRSTIVRTFAQALVTVPNANLANAAIINWSRMGKRRIKTTLGLTYNTTPEQITTILEDLKIYLENHEDIDQDTIFINFSGFGASTLDIFCYFFTKTTNWGEYMNVKEKVFLEFMKIITHKNQASFAFPSQSVYLEKNDLS